MNLLSEFGQVGRFLDARPGGEQAVQLKVAEKAVDAFRNVANESQTTLIVPGNMSEVSALIASAMRLVQAGRPTGTAPHA